MKKLLSVLFAVTLIFSVFTLCASAEEFVTVELNGVEMDFDVPAQIINDRTLVPLRGIFESLGATVEWDNDTETVTASKGDTSIALQIGSTSLFVNGEEKVIDVPAQLINDRTLVPARAVAESFGATVEWDEVNQKVIITDQSAPDFKAILDKMGQYEASLAAAEIGFDGRVAAEEYGIDLTFDGSLKLLQKTQESAIVFDAEIKVDEGELSYSSQGKVEIYVVKENGKLYQYESTTYTYSDDEEVYVDAYKSEGEPIIMDGVDMTLTGLGEITPFLKVAKQDVVGDKAAVKYAATITGHDIDAFILQAAKSGLIPAADAAEYVGILPADAQIKIYVWALQEDGALAKVGVDLVDVLNAYFESIEDESTVSECYFNLSIDGIDTVKEIVVPQEVKDAAEEYDEWY